jgi:hypothetical protein
MIAFGCAITEPEVYERHAGPGIELAAEADSARFVFRATSSIFRSYNLILDRAAPREELEALVLVHQDTEIVDPELCARLRRALADPHVGVVGCIGATGVRSIAWWEGSVTWASFIHRYAELGGGDLPGFSWPTGERPAFARTGEVDVVDGFLMALSPWAVRNLRFDESLSNRHGYEFDLCAQARAARREVVAGDLRVVHHHSLHLVTDNEPWVAAHIRVADKWEDSHGDEDQWRRRARRAEAEAAVARLVVASRQYQADALARERDRRLRDVTRSASWRVTAPLRRLNALRRKRTRAPG